MIDDETLAMIDDETLERIEGNICETLCKNRSNCSVYGNDCAICITNIAKDIIERNKKYIN